MTDATEDTLRCRRCGRDGTADDLDRMLWCEECVAAERRRSAWWGRGLALVAAILFALWIALEVRPGPDFRILWAVLLAFAYYLLARLARELAYGIIRVRNRPSHRRVDGAGYPPGHPEDRLPSEP